ncbi:HK97-gp10 family putative phage morphogenesis protein [Novosphingobium album (ex Liu et al. 2023)]|uniref:HK97 gp10 family phage protein n=1 Tax=Novosphingobium album (ex Liu et al. 2023) TaxID=3031130 RepID=A0ABT5WP96_9SPHN|nr:HK97-gp10 family putative phage morphogenesis protein [Novosphingobium album (ex Liu et al. 2023)]MDE8651875.1 HK97 gp10 family phage protein [Novosphingobium album (ex Liu et al. 2023)]
MRFDMSGFDEAMSNIRKVGMSLSNEVMSEIAQIALEPVAEDARALAPVDTGALRESIIVTGIAPRGSRSRGDEDVLFDGRTVFVGPLAAGAARRKGHEDTFYAGFVELGTVNMRAQPFLLPAWEANKDHVVVILGDLAGRAILSAV